MYLRFCIDRACTNDQAYIMSEIGSNEKLESILNGHCLFITFNIYFFVKLKNLNLLLNFILN